MKVRRPGYHDGRQVRTTPKGVNYLIHFDEPIGNGTPRGSAQHYTGFTTDLNSRLADHAAGKGARIMEVLRERGIGWHVVDVHPGNQDIERLLKQHSARRRCPECSPEAKRPAVVEKAIKAEKRRQARAARKEAREQERREFLEAVSNSAPRPRPTLEELRARGAGSGERFVRRMAAAGKSPEEIARVLAQATAPFHEAPRSEKAHAEFGGFTTRAATDLANYRAQWEEKQQASYEAALTAAADRETRQDLALEMEAG